MAITKSARHTELIEIWIEICIDNMNSMKLHDHDEVLEGIGLYEMI